ncbi:MAG: sugar phosphate isomerase/epimerase [Planctomycetes bacterium]|nr:sugar phosphate isomerase/epimerase [Planctomycetota bacterium]
MTDSIAIGTAYTAGAADPGPYLRHIARAGFKHIHWSFHCFGDFLYGRAELDYIAKLLAELHLSVNDLHGSDGQEKLWGSPVEYQRRAGVELVRNRIDMAQRLGCDVVVMHAPHEPETSPDREAYWLSFRRSLDELQHYAAGRGVRIAIENMPNPRYPDFIGRLFEMYPPEFMGLCYDTGHGNFLHKHFLEATVPPPAPNGLDVLERYKDRLIAVHLHDNDGLADLHRLPFSGTVDWEAVARLIAVSGYAKQIMTLEVSMKFNGIADEDEFLQAAALAGEKFADMVRKVMIG